MTDKDNDKDNEKSGLNVAYIGIPDKGGSYTRIEVKWYPSVKATDKPTEDDTPVLVAGVGLWTSSGGIELFDELIQVLCDWLQMPIDVNEVITKPKH